MSVQSFFNYQFNNKNDKDNFFVNNTNLNAYNLLIDNNFDQNIFLFGPIKSGKSHLLKMWKEKNEAIILDNNFNEIINLKKNIAIDNIFNNKSEEEIFHIINHCKTFNLKILATSSIELINYNYLLPDFISRLKSFYHIKINEPDEEMCKIILTKFFYEKQIIVKNKEIFDYIFVRVNRTYYDIYLLVEKIDKLSLEKKRELTIPLIKEIL